MRKLLSQRFELINGLLTLSLLLVASHVIFVHATQFEYVTSEETIIEWTQEIMLALMIGLGGYAAVVLRRWRELFVAIAAVAAMMLIREQNNWFKRELFSGAWQLCVLAVLIPVSAWLIPRWQRFSTQFRQVIHTSSGTNGLTGLLVLLVFSRLLGRKEIWEGIMGDNFVYSVKMVMEESTELLGYSLMLAALISLVLRVKYVWQPANRTAVSPQASSKQQLVILGEAKDA